MDYLPDKHEHMTISILPEKPDVNIQCQESRLKWEHEQ